MRIKEVIGRGLIAGALAVTSYAAIDTLTSCTKPMEISGTISGVDLPFKITLSTEWVGDSVGHVSEWGLRPTVYGASVVLKRGKERIEIAMTDDEYKESLDIYVDDAIRELKLRDEDNPLYQGGIALPAVRVENEIKEFAPTKVANLKATRIDFSRNFSLRSSNDPDHLMWLMRPTADNEIISEDPSTKSVLMNRAYIIKSNNEIFEIVYQAPPEEFKKGVAEFDKIVSTFQVTGN